MLMLGAIAEGSNGRYALAADMIKSVKVPFPIKDIPASEAASEEMKQKMTGKSNVIWLPVTINGKKYEFILDTLVRTDAILGMDFLKLAGNIRIDFKRNTVTFGRVDHKSNGCIPNLYIEPNNTLCLSASINSEPQVLKLDTGCTMTDLSYIWYCAHKDSTSDLEESNVLLGTYGSTEKKGLLSMPGVPFELGGKEAIVHNALIHTAPDGNQNSGTVGLELLRKFNKVNINLRDMSLTVE